MTAGNAAADATDWFPGLFRPKTGTKVDGKPKLRIICFPPAGCAEDVYSSEGTGARRAASPMLEWARKNDAEVLAVQYPGAPRRPKESARTSIAEIVGPLHDVLADYCRDGAPYVVVGHSVGTWIAYELLRLVERRAAEGGRTLKMPEHVFFSAFPSPSIPAGERPWNANEGMSGEEFKAECKAWNVNEVILADKWWEIYEPLLRADFTLFDQYEFGHAGAKKFEWTMTVFHGKDDGRVTEAMCRGWKDQTTGKIQHFEIDGHHLFPLSKEPKAAWLKHIARELENTLEVMELQELYGAYC